MRAARRAPAYESILRFGMFAVGTMPVAVFTVLALALLSSMLGSDATARATTQLSAARAVLDQDRSRLATLATSYADWPHFLAHVEAGDLLGARTDILDYQVASGLADASVLIVGDQAVSSGDPLLIPGLAGLAGSARQGYMGVGDGVYLVACVPVALPGRAGAAWLAMASRIGAADVAELKGTIGWDVAILDATGGIAVASSLALAEPLGQPLDGASVTSWDGRLARGTSALPGINGSPAGYLSIVAPDGTVSTLPTRIGLLLLLIVVATLVGATILSAAYGRLLGRRTESLRLALGAIAAGDLSVRIPEGSGGPLEELAGSHNRLAGLLDRREEELRTLADALQEIPSDVDLALIVHAGLQAISDTLGLDGAALIDDDGEVSGTIGDGAGEVAAEQDAAAPSPARAGGDGGRMAADHDAPPARSGQDLEVGLGPALPDHRLRVRPGAQRALTAWDRSLVQVAAAQLGRLVRDAQIFAGASRRADDLDRLSRLQSNFLRGVSHNLNGPLTSIQMLAEDLADQPGEGIAHERALAIAGETDRLRRLVEEILVMARLDAGTLQLSLTPFAPVPVIRRIWTSLQSTRPCSIEDESGGRLVLADRSAFEQVVWMLLDNAVTYAPGGPITVRLEPAEGRAADGPPSSDPVPAERVASGPRLRISVRDTGPGIPIEERELIFRRFQRGSTSDGTRGTGLGLDVARGLLAAMDGRIWYEASARPAQGAGPGRRAEAPAGTRIGATFVVTLPAEIPDEPA